MQYKIDLIVRHPNSYSAKEKIKALGGRWRPSEKGWLMPNMEAYNQAIEACDNVSEKEDRRSQLYNLDIGTEDDWEIATQFPHQIYWDYSCSNYLDHLWHGDGCNDCFYVGKRSGSKADWVIALRCHHSYKKEAQKWGKWDNVHQFWYISLEVSSNTEFVEQVKNALLTAAYYLRKNVPSTVRLQFNLKPGTQEKMLEAFKKGVPQAKQN